MSWNLGRIGLFTLELFALECGIYFPGLISGERSLPSWAACVFIMLIVGLLFCLSSTPCSLLGQTDRLVTIILNFSASCFLLGQTDRLVTIILNLSASCLLLGQTNRLVTIIPNSSTSSSPLGQTGDHHSELLDLLFAVWTD